MRPLLYQVETLKSDSIRQSGSYPGKQSIYFDNSIILDIIYTLFYFMGYTMDKRHQDSLTSRLEDAYINGCSHISWSELYHWYGVQKIAARTYRDIEARWYDVTEGEVGKLMKVEGRGGIFIYGEKNAAPVDQNNLMDKL